MSTKPTPFDIRRPARIKAAEQVAHRLGYLIRGIAEAREDGFGLAHLDRIEHVLHRLHDNVEHLVSEIRPDVERDAELSAEADAQRARIGARYGSEALHGRFWAGAVPKPGVFGAHTPNKFGGVHPDFSFPTKSPHEAAAEPTVPESLLEKIDGWETQS